MWGCTYVQLVNGIENGKCVNAETSLQRIPMADRQKDRRDRERESGAGRVTERRTAGHK